MPVLAASDETQVIGGLLLVAAVALYFTAIHALRRKRLIEDVPTSRTKGVAIGLTELRGRAVVREPIASYLAEVDCGWYRFSVEEHYRRTERDSKGKETTRTGWETVQRGEDSCPFDLEDEEGRIQIRPHGAELTGHEVYSRSVSQSDPLYYEKGPHSAIRGSTGQRRFREDAIREGDSLYVLGNARLRDDIPAPEIAQDPGGDPFLITTQDEAALTSGYGWQYGLAQWFGIALAGVGAALLGGIEHGQPPWPWVIAAVGLFGLASFCAYAVILFNGLVAVLHRMEKAWSLIDVQLQRRHDLIPRLVEVVKASAAHERGVLESLTALRHAPEHVRGRPDAGQVARSGAVADEQTAVLSQLAGVVEAYPQLQNHANFLALQRELADTEDRIALARGFYNASVETYNRRIAQVPDLLFASLLGYQRAAFYQIAEFQRRPVRIDLGG